MGRVIGDRGTAFQIVDMCDLPEHQERGLGKQIMTALMEHLRQRAPRTAYISLIADGDARHLYGRYGFEETARLRDWVGRGWASLLNADTKPFDAVNFVGSWLDGSVMPRGQ